MSKLFIFGIGGTGSRVLRSLTMLLAAGVKISTDEIVPIIIDPDNANADLTRAVALLNKYSAVRSNLHFSADNPSQFFRTGVEQILPNYTLLIQDTDDKQFQEFISLPSMSRANQAMARMLFSEKNLTSSMEVGFKGNPNIGSVVLNQIAHSDDFQSFANQFGDGDRIFIISSIFGGTGASGFPLLLKTLREGRNFSNFQLINNAPIGAITILPYFKLEHDDTSEIDSSTFISKAKSALAYYEKNIISHSSSSRGVDSLYFLADDIANTYQNNEGGAAQQNDAHLIEFLAASAIVDFTGSMPQPGTMSYELGVKDLEGTVTFNSLYNKMRDMLYRPLVQFSLMANAFTFNRDYFTSDSFNANKGNFDNLYISRFFNELCDFFELYRQWLGELKNNKRSLDMFNLNTGNKPFELVTDVKPRRIVSLYSDYNLFADRLNSFVGKCKSKDKEDKFLEMFYRGTEKLVSEKL